MPGGRKRHILVDTLGLLIVVVVTAANLPERAGAKLVFAQVKKERSKFWRLVRIWVEIKFSIFSRQCLNRRIPDIKTMKQEVKAWTKQRNGQQATVDWRFTCSDARVKLE